MRVCLCTCLKRDLCTKPNPFPLFFQGAATWLKCFSASTTLSLASPTHARSLCRFSLRAAAFHRVLRTWCAIVGWWAGSLRCVRATMLRDSRWAVFVCMYVCMCVCVCVCVCVCERGKGNVFIFSKAQCERSVKMSEMLMHYLHTHNMGNE